MNITEKIEALEATINSASSELEKLKQELNKPALGCFRNRNWPKALLFNNNNSSYYGFNNVGDWTTNYNFIKTEMFPATDEEAEEALIKYFESQHGKPSNKWKVKGFWGNDIKSIGNSGYYYTKSGENIYFGYGSTCLMLNGKWAEIIKDEPIRIGGYEVKKCDNNKLFKIGPKNIHKDEIISISKVMYIHDFKKVAFDGIETDLETIEKILRL